jgi:lactate permease
MDPSAFSHEFYSRMAFTNIFTGTFVPVLIIASVLARSGKKNVIGDIVEILPLSIFSGLVFTVPVYFIATFIGPEIPSLLGALIGLVILISSVRAGFLVPKNVWRFESDPIVEVTHETKSKIPLFQAWSPYVIIAIVLVITRLPWLPIKGFIDRSLIVMKGFLGVEGINFNWKIFNNPGLFPFILVAVIYMLANKLPGRDIGEVFKKTFKQITNAAIALLAGVALVQIMRFTNFSNPSGTLDAMTTEVAKALANLFGALYPLVSPIVGVFGAFVSGSNTVSNTMFAALQFETAVIVGLPTVLILICQSMGGAIGNMVCVNNVVAVSATTGAEGKEGQLIMAALIPCLIYSLMVSIATFIYIAAGTAAVWIA